MILPVLLMASQVALAADVGLKLGARSYVGSFSSALRPGVILSPEVMFGELFQVGPWYNVSIHNGTYYEEQAAVGGPFIQGDTRTNTFGLRVGGKFAMRPKTIFRPQLGIGMMAAPLLMDEPYYLDEVVGKAWSGMNPDFHSSRHPTVELGLELNTSKFSAMPGLGLELAAGYAVGFDAYVNILLTLRPNIAPSQRR